MNQKFCKSDENKIINIKNIQSQIFQTRLESNHLAVNVTQKKVQNFSNQISSLSLRLKSTQNRAALLNSEYLDYKNLLEEGLIARNLISNIEREISSLTAEEINLSSQIEQLNSQIIEQRLELDRHKEAFHEKVLSDLSNTNSSLVELEKEIVATEAFNRRVVIKSPDSGYIHDMSVSSIGAVIAPGEEILRLVPNNRKLVASVFVYPTDIDQVKIGQEARVRLTAFNQNTTPEFQGVVQKVSADILIDEASQQRYFSVFIDVLPNATGIQLKSGMPVETYILGNERTVLSYLLKPIADAFSRTFRDQ